MAIVPERSGGGGSEEAVGRLSGKNKCVIFLRKRREEGTKEVAEQNSWTRDVG